MKYFFALAVIMVVLHSCAGKATKTATATDQGWVPLFNGKDIKDWNVKINHHDYNENFGNTFRVEDGIIKVRYDQYKDFNEQFGHLYYKTPFSYFHLKFEYRFV